MSLRTDPDGVVEVYLDADEDVAPNKRPVFLCKNVSCREAGKYSAEVNSILGSDGGDEEKANRAAEILAGLVKSTRNIPQDKGGSRKEMLLDCCTTTELWELFYKIVGGMVTRDDKKK